MIFSWIGRSSLTFCKSFYLDRTYIEASRPRNVISMSEQLNWSRTASFCARKFLKKTQWSRFLGGFFESVFAWAMILRTVWLSNMSLKLSNLEKCVLTRLTWSKYLFLYQGFRIWNITKKILISTFIKKWVNILTAANQSKSHWKLNSHNIWSNGQIFIKTYTLYWKMAAEYREFVKTDQIPPWFEL